MPLLPLPIRHVGVVTDDSQLSAHTFTKQELRRSGSFDVNGVFIVTLAVCSTVGVRCPKLSPSSTESGRVTEDLGFYLTAQSLCFLVRSSLPQL